MGGATVSLIDKTQRGRVVLWRVSSCFLCSQTAGVEPVYTYDPYPPSNTHTHNAKEANSATYSSHHRHTVYLCEEVAHSWRVKSTGKEPDITQKPFLFWCEDIVGESLEGEKTGHSTVEPVFLCASLTLKRKICLHVWREVSAWMGTSYLKCARLLICFILCVSGLIIIAMVTVADIILC